MTIPTPEDVPVTAGQAGVYLSQLVTLISAPWTVNDCLVGRVWPMPAEEQMAFALDALNVLQDYGWAWASRGRDVAIRPSMKTGLFERANAALRASTELGFLDLTVKS